MTQLVEQKLAVSLPYSPEHISLIKNQICKGATDLELQLFLHVCQKTGLDPLVKQIYSVKYGADRSVIVSIDGFRSVAENTGCYAPGKEATFKYDGQGRLKTATAYVKKMTKDGTWHEISESAEWDEYGSDKPFWKKMPHVMLSKCAEARALRRAFPKQLAGLYSEEEMDQASKKGVKDVEIANVEAVLHIPEENVGQEMGKFFSQFPGEDHALMENYLSRYAKHYEKSLGEALADYKGNPEKFFSDFSCWRKKHNKAA